MNSDHHISVYNDEIQFVLQYNEEIMNSHGLWGSEIFKMADF